MPEPGRAGDAFAAAGFSLVASEAELDRIFGPGVGAAVAALSRAVRARTLDCAGRTITPGFIDIHSHSDWLLLLEDAAERVGPFLQQGVTTLVGGNCGFSPAPVTERSREAARASRRLILDEEVDPPAGDMDAFLGLLGARGIPMNLVELVGHGAIRSAVRGPSTPPRPPRTSSPGPAAGPPPDTSSSPPTCGPTRG